jgi:hypothetical protein
VLKACSNLVGGRIQSRDNLDRLEWTAQASLHIAKAQSEAKICGRFVGGSARNRAVLGNPGQLGHDMQFAQSRINTGDCASR